MLSNIRCRGRLQGMCKGSLPSAAGATMEDRSETPGLWAQRSDVCRPIESCVQRGRSRGQSPCKSIHGRGMGRSSHLCTAPEVPTAAVSPLPSWLQPLAAQPTHPPNNHTVTELHSNPHLAGLGSHNCIPRKDPQWFYITLWGSCPLIRG